MERGGGPLIVLGKCDLGEKGLDESGVAAPQGGEEVDLEESACDDACEGATPRRTPGTHAPSAIVGLVASSMRIYAHICSL